MASNAVIHLIDDDEAVRKSLVFSLAAAGLTVRAYESAVQFLENIEEIQPGCIVTDVRMPGIDGLELQRQLKDAGKKIPVIVMTGHGDVRLAVEAMRAGAIEFLEKPFDDDVLLAAIKMALAQFAITHHEETERQQVQTRLSILTARELEVLKGLLAGLPNKTIAYDLNLSARTVEVHRANLMKKMQANSLSDLVRMALAGEVLAKK